MSMHSLQPASIRPDDLDAWWDALDAELATFPAAPESTISPLHSTDHSTTYVVKLTSIGSYRFEVFLSIPDGEGPFPAIFLAPGYGSVVTPPSYDDRMRYVAMAVRYRGTRGADKPYAAKFPGMLTDGIDDPNAWIYRSILADTLRAFDYLCGLPMVDTSRVVVNGNDIGLLVAARRDGVAALAVGASFFYRLTDVYPQSEAYPVEEINDYLREFPDRREAVNRTLAYVDPLHQASAVTADTLVVVNDAGSVGGPEWLEPLVQALGGAVEQYPMSHEGQTDYDAVERWLAQQQGVEPRPRTWVPQDIGPWSASRA
jgi:cephalosporin-C deacetylase-like acetyl esterase